MEKNLYKPKLKEKNGYNRKNVKCQVKKNTSLSLRDFLIEEGVDVDNNEYVCMKCFKLTCILHNGKTR